MYRIAFSCAPTVGREQNHYLSCSYPCPSITISDTDTCTYILLNHHF